MELKAKQKKTQAVDAALVFIVEEILAVDRREKKPQKAIANIVNALGQVYDLAHAQGVGVGFAEGIQERIFNQ